jgi:hypothetical protein
MKKLVGLIAIIFIFIHASIAQSEVEASSNPIRVNFKAKDTSAPDVFLVYKNSGIINDEGNVEASIRILDEAGIASVLINGTAQRNAPNDTLIFNLSFKPNEEVVVVAKDNFSNVKEKSFLIKAQESVVVNATSAPNARKFYALLIGVNEYHDPAITSLNEPIKDAEQLKEALTKNYTFEESNVSLLKNPTFEDLNVAFEELTKHVSPNDFLLIFYAGHGYFDEKTNIGYWLPADASEKNRAKWFRNSALVENIGAINSKHTLLIADACFSGGIFKTRAPFDNSSIDVFDMLKRPSRKAMTSGSLTTVPDKSVFMKYLLKSLNENNNKYLPSEDLFDDIRLSMKNNSNTKPLYGEIQNVGDEGGNFVFVKKE